MADPKKISERLAALATQRHPSAGNLMAVPPDGISIEAEVEEAWQHRARERWVSAIPRRYWKATVDDLSASNATAIRQWANDEHPEGTNLAIGGPVGTGKTHAAVAAMRAWMSAHRPDGGILMVTVVDLLDSMRPSSSVRLHCDPRTVPLLLLDDLGVERPTDWTAERFDGIITSRYNEMLPTIVTTNVVGDELMEWTGSRAASRLFGSAVTLAIKGDDRRRGK